MSRTTFDAEENFLFLHAEEDTDRLENFLFLHAAQNLPLKSHRYNHSKWKKVNIEKSQNWTYIKVIKHQSTWHWHTGSSRRYKPSLLLSPHLYQVCTDDTLLYCLS
jgi:hypothetical protein